MIIYLRKGVGEKIHTPRAEIPARQLRLGIYGRKAARSLEIKQPGITTLPRREGKFPMAAVQNADQAVKPYHLCDVPPKLPETHRWVCSGRKGGVKAWVSKPK